jgi:hypothetical protein
MRLLSRIADHAELVFDVIWGFIGIGILVLALGIAALGYDTDHTVVASNTTLPTIHVEGTAQ